MFASSPSLHCEQDEEPSELMWPSGQDSQPVLSVFFFVPAGQDSGGIDGFVSNKKVKRDVYFTGR